MARAGENKTIEFTISPEMMMLFEDDGKQKSEPGQFRLTVGGCSPDVRGVAMGAAEPVSLDVARRAGGAGQPRS